MATHGVLSGPAIDRLKNCADRTVVITNTVPLPSEKQIDKIEVLSVAGDHRRRHRRRVRGHVGQRDLRRREPGLSPGSARPGSASRYTGSCPPADRS